MPKIKTLLIYSPSLNITNADQLKRGAGTRLLECIRGEGDELVAIQWRRLIPEDYQILVAFSDSRIDPYCNVVKRVSAITLELFQDLDNLDDFIAAITAIEDSTARREMIRVTLEDGTPINECRFIETTLTDGSKIRNVILSSVE